jgi:3-methyl-2-oxobutanoate hydroxymethyltransferase
MIAETHRGGTMSFHSAASISAPNSPAATPSAFNSPAKVTHFSLLEKKLRREPITALTACDYPTARLLDEAGIDLILVGDSLAMTVLGYDSTLPLTVDEMLHHAKAARRGVERSLFVVDMPYGSYHVNDDEAVRNAIRFVQEAGAEAVKLEGGSLRAPLIERLTRAEIPVIGHIGLTPQSVYRMGGYRVQGKTSGAITQLLNDAVAIEAAGAIALVLEGIPREVGARITAAAGIPTIGIGAGPDCDGQILVFHDLSQLTFAPPAKFVRPFANAGDALRQGLVGFRQAVEARTFPSDAESYHLSAPVRAELEQRNLVAI